MCLLFGFLVLDLFQGVLPVYEDPVNLHGGHWLIGFPSQDSKALNQSWLHLVCSLCFLHHCTSVLYALSFILACAQMLHLIGEQFEDSEEIVGLQFIFRPKDHRMQLWMRNGIQEEVIMRVARNLRQCLEQQVKLKVCTDFI